MATKTGDGFAEAPNFFTPDEFNETLVEFESPTTNAFRKQLNNKNNGFSLSEKESEDDVERASPSRGRAVGRIPSVDFFDFASQDTWPSCTGGDASPAPATRKENNDTSHMSSSDGNQLKFSVFSNAVPLTQLEDEDEGADITNRSGISKLIPSSPLRSVPKPKLGSLKNLTASPTGTGGAPISPSNIEGSDRNSLATSKMPAILLSPMGKMMKKKKQFDINEHIGEITVHREKLPIGKTSTHSEPGVQQKPLKFVDGNCVVISPPVSPVKGTDSPLSAKKKKKLEKKFRNWWAGQSAGNKDQEGCNGANPAAVNGDGEMEPSQPAELIAGKALEMIVDRASSVPYVAAGDKSVDDEDTVSPTQSGTSTTSSSLHRGRERLSPLGKSSVRNDEVSLSPLRRISSLSPQRNSKSVAVASTVNSPRKRCPHNSGSSGEEHLSSSKHNSQSGGGSNRRGRRSRRSGAQPSKRDRSASAGPRLEWTPGDGGGSSRRGRRTTGVQSKKEASTDLHTVLSAKSASPRRATRASAGRDRRSLRSQRTVPCSAADDRADTASIYTDAKSVAQSVVSFNDAISKSSTASLQLSSPSILSPASSPKRPVSILRSPTSKSRTALADYSSDDDLYHDKSDDECRGDDDEDDKIERYAPSRTVSDRYREVGITAEQLRGLRALGLDITDAQLAGRRVENI